MTNAHIQYFVNKVSDFDIDLYYFNCLCLSVTNGKREF